ncbi:MAG: tetratricopeptide repeat protein [Saprospiraceae bacterium]|nr:tetratricopeptide repeat protein [Saprospiraceae bacterium]
MGISFISEFYANQKQYKKAEEAYKKLIALEPNNPFNYLYLGNFYNNEKKYDKAEDNYKKRIELAPTDPVNYRSLATFYYYQNRFEESEVAYKKMIELAPTDANYYRLIGIFYEHLNQYEKAEAAYKKMIELAPTDPESYTSMGYLYQTQKRYEEAAKYYQKASELDLNNFDNHMLVINLLGENLSKWEEVEQFEKKLLDFDSTNVIAPILLAITYCNARRDYQSAILVLERYFSLHSNEPIYYYYLGTAIGKPKNWNRLLTISKTLLFPVPLIKKEICQLNIT